MIILAIIFILGLALTIYGIATAPEEEEWLYISVIYVIKK
jgi:hypothetical protein